MYPTDPPSGLRVRVVAPFAVMLTAAGLFAPALYGQEPDASAEPPKAPPRQMQPGEAIRLAVTLPAVNTPIFVRAYDRFREKYGPDVLKLDLWVEQEWADDPRPLAFGDYGMVLALRCNIPGLEEALAEAAAGGTWVVSDSNAKHAAYAVVIDELPELAPYYRQRGVANAVGLLERIAETFGTEGVTARPVEDVPTEGLYHPDADRVFASAEDYWRWYETTPAYEPDGPKVGIFVYNTLYLNEETDYFSELIRGVERAGGNPVLGFGAVGGGRNAGDGSPLADYFAGVDVLLTSSFRLMMETTAHAEALEELDVPVLNSIILNETAAEWRDSRQGISPSYLLPGVITPELAGIIEPTVIAAREPVTNAATGQTYYRTVVIDENYRWQVRRALKWAELRRTAAAERRVALLYYNHNAGKQDLGASYLNVTASLPAILRGLKERGYAVEGALGRDQLIAAIRATGRNVGSWAPGELDRLVENGAVLWPVEEYLAHFDRLPGEFKREIVRQWGQPPGDLMTVERDGGRFFVLPAFQLGNVLVGPQPSRAHNDRHEAVYHDPNLMPTHQYLAFYFWLRHAWGANAVVHLGRHGTLEFLPGKSNGLSANDPPAVALGDLPNVNPYIVDGIGEGVASKRRGQGVLVTHATPPLTRTPLYADLAKLRELTDRYVAARDAGQSGLQKEYFRSVVKLAESLGYSRTPPTAEQTDRHERYVSDVSHWLGEVESQTGPRGLHTFGEPYSAADTADMLPRMFRDEFAALRDAGMTAEQERDWLAELTDAEGTAPPDESDPNRRTIAAAAWAMRHNGEVDGLAHALGGGYLEAGPPGDPLSNPAIFPTGRNQFQVNPDKLPSREAWAVGQRMAEQTIALHTEKYGEPPTKLGITLWANTLIRTDGVLEAEVLSLLGVEPVWSSRGDLIDVRLVDPPDRPRIDVVMTVTGMYRDSFPEKILLLDRAVRLAAEAEEQPGRPNHVRRNAEAVARELIGAGGDAEASRKRALLRIFGAPTGQYGTGVDHFVSASQGWSDEYEIADHYMERMANSFSGDGWAQPGRALFERQLSGVQGVIHGRSSNLYGLLDITENFEYQGAFALSVGQIDGRTPDLYMNDLVGGGGVRTGREAVVLELLSRYHNPEFIAAMRDEGFDGARYISRIADNQFGWDAVSEVIEAKDWEAFAEIYIEDKYELGLREFFETTNPHALQNVAARVLEVDRKRMQDLSEATLRSAAAAYVASVAAHGPACESHVCANPELADFAEAEAAASGAVSAEQLTQFRDRLAAATGRPNETPTPAGASAELATAPQPVAGPVILPAPPEVKSGKTENDAGRRAPAALAGAAPQVENPAELSAELEDGVPEGVLEASGEPAPTAAWFIVGVLALTFLGGIGWRIAASR